MYTVFSASNREHNKSRFFADHCCNSLIKRGIENVSCNLEDLPADLLSSQIYDFKNDAMDEIVEKYLRHSQKLIFVMPEYNGSFPGILKLLIDAIHPRNFKGKKAALIGISSGKSGNVRGMDHLTNILNYLKVDVYHYKLAISGIDKLLSDNELNDEVTVGRLERQIDGFVNF